MSQLQDVPCAIRGFHYYRRYWTPYLGEKLICQHDDVNPFDVFAIKTCSLENGQIYGHLPMEISRATKFLIDRGARVFVEVSATHYRRSPLVQGGLEIPCKLSVELAIATIKNNMLIDRYKKIIQELYEEPTEEVIMGSLLLDDFADFSEMADSETNVSNATRPQNRKRKPDEVNEKASKKSNQETDQPSSSRNDIRKFFKVLPKKKKEEKCNKNSKKSNIIVID